MIKFLVMLGIGYAISCVYGSFNLSYCKTLYFSGTLRLTRPVFGPKHFLVRIQMNVFNSRNFLSAKHMAYVDIEVSNYEF